MSRARVYTLGDARDERARAEARTVAFELADAKADLERRHARACERYALYRGALHRLARMKLARAVRALAVRS